MIRPTARNDLPALKRIIDGTGLFPSDMLDEMIADFFNNPHSEALWITFHGEEGVSDDPAGGEPLGLAFSAPEPMTDGTWNVSLVAVAPEAQGRGVGTALMAFLEEHLTERGVRLLLVETSGTPAFERTRTFYHKLGYDEEAVIRDFYGAGDDKVIFRKALQSA